MEEWCHYCFLENTVKEWFSRLLPDGPLSWRYTLGDIDLTMAEL